MAKTKTYPARVAGRRVCVTVPESDHGVEDLVQAAGALLRRVEMMTSDQFARGGERAEREALRRALVAVGWDG